MMVRNKLPRLLFLLLLLLNHAADALVAPSVGDAWRHWSHLAATLDSSLLQTEESFVLDHQNEPNEESTSPPLNYPGRLGVSHAAEHRCGFVSVIGAPNMGKSTLVNALLAHDLCIVNRRPQTTRHRILTLLSTPTAQVCLVDTPGVIMKPAYSLQEGMMEAVVTALKDADVLLIVTDLFSTPIPSDDIFARVLHLASYKPIVVAINKIDLVDQVKSAESAESDKTVTVEQAVAQWRQWIPQALAIIPLCASRGPDDVGVQALRAVLTGSGTDSDDDDAGLDPVAAAWRRLGRPIAGQLTEGRLFLNRTHVQHLLPVSPPLYDPENWSDRPMRFFAAELIRAALLETLRQELPYCCEVLVTEFKEPVAGSKSSILRLAADIIVERDSQKVILIGKNGQQIKQVGMVARTKLQDFFQSQVRCLSTASMISIVFPQSKRFIC
jgi:small GTP-binding protein